MGGRKRFNTYVIIYIIPTTRGSSRWKISKSLGSSAVKHLKCKWTHSSSPMLHINYRHHISALFFAFWAQTTCFMKCLSFYQRINMQFVRRMRDPLPSGKDGFLPPKLLCFQFWVFFFCEVGFIDSSEVSSLTNCIFKFWSNTTLRLVLYLCTRVASSLNCGWTHCEVLYQNLAPDDLQIQRLKQKASQLSLFLPLMSLLVGISLSQICFWKPLWCQITSSNYPVCCSVCTF